jgi:hypothetical protein
VVETRTKSFHGSTEGHGFLSVPLTGTAGRQKPVISLSAPLSLSHSLSLTLTLSLCKKGITYTQTKQMTVFYILKGAPSIWRLATQTRADK